MRVTEIIDDLYKEAGFTPKAVAARGAETVLGAGGGAWVGSVSAYNGYGEQIGKPNYQWNKKEKAEGRKWARNGAITGAVIGGVGGPVGNHLMGRSTASRIKHGVDRSIKDTQDYAKRGHDFLHTSPGVSGDDLNAFKKKWVDRDYAKDFENVKAPNRSEEIFGHYRNSDRDYWNSAVDRDRIRNKLHEGMIKDKVDAQTASWHRQWKDFEDQYKRYTGSNAAAKSVNHHDILKKYGLNASTIKTKKEVDQLRRQMAKKYHPDINKAPDAVKKMQEANADIDALQGSSWYNHLAYIVESLDGLYKQAGLME